MAKPSPALIVMCLSQIFLSLAVVGDETLVEVTCAKTSSSDFCKACFDESKNTTLKQEIRGLAGTAINCAFNTSLTVRDSFASCSTNNNTDALKDACGQCKGNFDGAIGSIISAIKGWLKEEYAFSRGNLSAAVQQGSDCSLSLKGSGGPLPAALLKEMSFFIGYASVAEETVAQVEPENN